MIDLLMLAVLAAAPSSADTFLRRRARSDGYRGMGAFESETSRKISGVKAREEGTFKFTGAILGRLSRKKPGAVEILRVDLDKRWSLDPKKKTYTESAITLKKGEDAEDEKEAREIEHGGRRAVDDLGHALVVGGRRCPRPYA